MKFLVPILLAVFLLVPTIAFSKAVENFSDVGLNVSFVWSQSAKITYEKVKAELGDIALEGMIEGWLQKHANRYKKNEALKIGDRLDILSPADKKKVMDQLSLCETGQC